MQFGIHDFVTIEIDDEFPWQDDWRNILSNVPGGAEPGPGGRRTRMRLNYTKELSDDSMLKIDEGIYASDEFLLDRKYGVRFRQTEQYALELWTNNACLEWQVWGIQLALLQNAASFIHCATVARDGEALMFAARGGVGKTTITRLLVGEMGWKFMGDDYIILSSDGSCYSFPQPMVLYSYHKGVFPEVFSVGRGPLSPALTNDLLSRMAVLIKPLLRPFPRALQFARKHNPQSVQIDPLEVFGREKLASQAVLTKVVWLERSPGLRRVRLEPEPERLVSRVFGSTYANLDPWCSRLITTAMSTGILDANDVYPKWLSVLDEAFARTSRYTLLLPVELRAEDMHADIRDMMKQMER